MTEESPVDPAEVRTAPFAALLTRINGGSTHAELSSDMQDLVAAVVKTGKAGTLQLTLRCEVAGEMILIRDKVVLKKPESRKATLMFVDDHYNLLDQNPEQPTLPLEIVPDPARGPLHQAGRA